MGDQLDLGSVIGSLGPLTCRGLCHGNPTVLLQHCKFPPSFNIFLPCCPHRAHRIRADGLPAHFALGSWTLSSQGLTWQAWFSHTLHSPHRHGSTHLLVGDL